MKEVRILVRAEFEFIDEIEKDKNFEFSFEDELEFKRILIKDLKEISPNGEVKVNKIFVKVIE